MINEKGYLKWIQFRDEEKNRLKKTYQEDLIGTLSELHTYVGMEIPDSREGKRILERIEQFLKAERTSSDVTDKILCLFSEYGIAIEESGFRRGFQVAMRLCMEGITGGTLL